MNFITNAALLLLYPHLSTCQGDGPFRWAETDTEWRIIVVDGASITATLISIAKTALSDEPTVPIVKVPDMR